MTLKLGSRNVVVAMLQNMLIGSGYLKSPATGSFDTNTQAAVTFFQKANNLTVTGSMTIDLSSLAAVAPPFTPVTAGAKGTEVTAIQKFFIARGYLKTAAPTGSFDATTQAAVEAFQKKNDIPQTGIIDLATFDQMNGR